MDWSKIDPALAAALEEVEEDLDGRRLPVAIDFEVAAAPAHRQILEELGVPLGCSPASGEAATLSARQVGALSEQPWVHRLRLARRLRLHSYGEEWSE